MTRDFQVQNQPGPLPDQPAPTRIWPSIALGLLTPGIVTGIAVLILASEFTDVDTAEEYFANQPLVLTATFLTMLLGLLLCLLVAFRSPLGPDRRVGLLRPCGHPASWALLMVATLGISIVSDLVLEWAGVGMPEEMEDLTRLLRESRGSLTLLWCFAIVLVGPVMEELLYRGVVLRGVLRQWSPWWAIAFSSWCFALAHGSWEYQLGVFPGGLLLGWIAYRTRSVWIPIGGHMLVNAYGVAAELAPEPWRTAIFNEPGVVSVPEVLAMVSLPFGIWWLWKLPGVQEPGPGAWATVGEVEAEGGNELDH